MMNTNTHWAAATCLLLAMATTATAANSDLVAAIDQAADAGLSLPTGDELGRLRQAAAAALDDAEQFLGQHGRLESWQRFLRLDACREALDGQSIDELAPARETLRRLTGASKGLELRVLVQLRSALRDYLEARQRLLLADELAEQYSEQLAELRDLVGGDQPAPREVRRRLEWIAARHQAPQLADQLRAGYLHPNLLVNVPRRSLGLVTEQPVSESRPVSSNNDDVAVRGTAVVTGMVRMVPVDGGLLQAEFSGHVDTRLAGAKGPAFFRLAGSTQLTACKKIFLAKDEFLVWPATAHACSTLRTECVGSTKKRLLGRLIRNVARKRIEKQRPESTRDLSQESADGFREDFDKEVGQEIGEARRDIEEDVLTPMVRLNTDLQRMEFRTNSRLLQVVMQFNSAAGLAAPCPPPPLTGEHVLAVRLHESMINQLAEQALRGDKVSLSELAEKLEQADEKEKKQEKAQGDKPQAAKRDAQDAKEAKGRRSSRRRGDNEEAELQILFADEHPLEVEFDNDELVIHIRGREFYIGDWIGSSMQVELHYGIEDAGDQIALVRRPKIAIRPLKGKGSFRFFSQRSVLRRRLAKELPERETLKPRELPKPGDKLGKLQPTRLTTTNGWLTVLLNNPSAPKMAATTGTP